MTITQNDHQVANYLRIALALQGVVVNNITSVRLCKTFELLSQKGGDVDLKDVSELEAALTDYEAREAIAARKKEQQS